MNTNYQAYQGTKELLKIGNYIFHPMYGKQQIVESKKNIFRINQKKQKLEDKLILKFEEENPEVTIEIKNINDLKNAISSKTLTISEERRKEIYSFAYQIIDEYEKQQNKDRTSELISKFKEENPEVTIEIENINDLKNAVSFLALKISEERRKEIYSSANQIVDKYEEETKKVFEELKINFKNEFDNEVCDIFINKFENIGELTDKIKVRKVMDDIWNDTLLYNKISVKYQDKTEEEKKKNFINDVNKIYDEYEKILGNKTSELISKFKEENSEVTIGIENINDLKNVVSFLALVAISEERRKEIYSSAQQIIDNYENQSKNKFSKLILGFERENPEVTIKIENINDLKNAILSETLTASKERVNEIYSSAQQIIDKYEEEEKNIDNSEENYYYYIMDSNKNKHCFDSIDLNKKYYVKSNNSNSDLFLEFVIYNENKILSKIENMPERNIYHIDHNKFVYGFEKVNYDEICDKFIRTFDNIEEFLNEAKDETKMWKKINDVFMNSFFYKKYFDSPEKSKQQFVSDISNNIINKIQKNSSKYKKILENRTSELISKFKEENPEVTIEIENINDLKNAVSFLALKISEERRKEIYSSANQIVDKYEEETKKVFEELKINFKNEFDNEVCDIFINKFENIGELTDKIKVRKVMDDIWNDTLLYNKISVKYQDKTEEEKKKNFINDVNKIYDEYEKILGNKTSELISKFKEENSEVTIGIENINDLKNVVSFLALVAISEERRKEIYSSAQQIIDNYEEEENELFKELKEKFKHRNNIKVFLKKEANGLLTLVQHDEYDRIVATKETLEVYGYGDKFLFKYPGNHYDDIEKMFNIATENKEMILHMLNMNDENIKIEFSNIFKNIHNINGLSVQEMRDIAEKIIL